MNAGIVSAWGKMAVPGSQLGRRLGARQPPPVRRKNHAGRCLRSIMPAMRRQLSPNWNGSDGMTFDAMHTRGLRSKVRQGMRALQAAAIALAIGGSLTGAVFAAEQADPWPELARDSFDGRGLKDGAGRIAIEIPYRAHGAAR